MSFRDLLPVPRKFSTDHIEYLSTKDPQKRIDIVQRIMSRCTSLEENHKTQMQRKHNGVSIDSSDNRGQPNQRESYLIKMTLIFFLPQPHQPFHYHPKVSINLIMLRYTSFSDINLYPSVHPVKRVIRKETYIFTE